MVSPEFSGDKPPALRVLFCVNYLYTYRFFKILNCYDFGLRNGVEQASMRAFLLSLRRGTVARRGRSKLSCYKRRDCFRLSPSQWRLCGRDCFDILPYRYEYLAMTNGVTSQWGLSTVIARTPFLCHCEEERRSNLKGKEGECGLHEYGISYDDNRGRLSYHIHIFMAAIWYMPKCSWQGPAARRVSSWAVES